MVCVQRRGYTERQKVYGVLVEAHSMNIFFVPQILGTGMAWDQGADGVTAVGVISR